MKTLWLSAAMALLIAAPPSSALQETKTEDPTAKERTEKRKQLQEINKVQDVAQKKELLEKFVQENKDPLILESAYNSLLGTLTNLDPNKTIELADQILAKPLGPRDSLRTTAYIHKFRAYQKQKNEEAIKALGLQILEAETDPSLLHVAADLYKDGALKFYEKAVAEKQKDEAKDRFPSLSHLYADYANELSRLGHKDRALENMSKASEVVQKQIAEIEALPEKDPKRRGIANLRAELGGNYHSMARILSETGDAKKGLDYLVKAEGLLEQASHEQRSSLEETRGSLYESLGNVDRSLESYVRSLAFRMNPKTMDKIKALAAKTGKPAGDYFNEARKVRAQAAQPFKPFELKTVEGETKSFLDLRSKVTLVNLFFPT